MVRLLRQERDRTEQSIRRFNRLLLTRDPAVAIECVRQLSVCALSTAGLSFAIDLLVSNISLLFVCFCSFHQEHSRNIPRVCRRQISHSYSV